MTDLKSTQSPEAMVYMRLLGNELGYLKTSEMEEMAYSAVMMIDSMMKMFPSDVRSWQKMCWEITFILLYILFMMFCFFSYFL